MNTEYLRLSVRSGRVLAYVRGRAVTRPCDVAEHLGLDPKRASEILSRLWERGLICKQARGLYAADVKSERDGML